MFTHKNLMTVCCAAVLALGLAACGSSGGDDKVVAVTDGGDNGDNGDNGAMPVDVNLTNVTNGTTAAAGTLEIEAGGSEDSGNTAFACAAGGDDCTVTVTMGDDGTVTAESTGGDVTAGNSEAHQMALDEAAGPTPEQLTPAQKTAAAATKVIAISAEADETGDDDAGLGGSTASAIDAGVAGSYALSIERDRIATKVTVTVNGEAADDSDDVEFMPQDMDLGAGNSMHVLKMDADADGKVVEEIVIVSTDIEVPTDIPFVMADADSKGRYALDANEDEDENAQSLDFSEDNHGGLAMLTDSRVAVPAPSGSVTLMGDNEATEDVKENEYRGTFDGAEGTFTCTVDGGCAVTVVDGEITNMESVHFTPDDEEVTVEEDDADYLNYGFWLKRTTDADGATTYNEVETFAGSLIDPSGDVIPPSGMPDSRWGFPSGPISDSMW